LTETPRWFPEVESEGRPKRLVGSWIEKERGGDVGAPQTWLLELFASDGLCSGGFHMIVGGHWWADESFVTLREDLGMDTTYRYRRRGAELRLTKATGETIVLRRGKPLPLCP
jgi:hypothetical protein